MVDVASSFSGSMPEYYDGIMGPAQFEPFAADLVRRVPARPPGDVLEIACGTGRVTRQLRATLDPAVKIVASDLSAAMLAYARSKHAELTGVDWHEADACKLPFPDGAFGVLVCAFGVMFVPDKQAAFREARRVLRAGGVFLFNVWDGLENNLHAGPSKQVLEALFPDDPAMKFASLPYMFNDRQLIAQLLQNARFRVDDMQPVRIACSCPSAREFATGQLRGTPRSALLQERGVSVDGVIGKIAAGLAEIGGAEPFRYTPQALVIQARAI